MEDATEWLKRQQRVDDLVLCSDFDGTLAPIVERPGEARALDGVAELMEAIAGKIPVAIISGRGLDDIVDRLGAEGLYYSGSHGLELQLPDATRSHPAELDELLPELDRQEEWLCDRFSEVPRVEIERKRFGIAVHFRRRAEAREIVESAIDKALARSTGLRAVTGKKVRELRPDVDLHKGTALRAILARLDAPQNRRPVYLGDDTTDEDVFEEIRDDGVGILVAEEPGDTAATYRLDDPQQVREFLRRLADRLNAENEG